MRFTFPAPVQDDDHDSCDEKARPTSRAATSSSHTAHADPHQAVPGQPRPPTTASTLSRGCSTSTSSAPAMAESSSSTSSAHPASSRRQRDEAKAETETQAARADLLARLQRCSVTDADWDNATSSSSSSDDESEDKDDKDLGSSHKDTTDHAARLTNQQGSDEANRDAATNNTSTAHVAFNSVASRQQHQHQPRPPGAGGRGHGPSQASGRRKSGPLQSSRRRCTGDSWVLLGRGEARPLGPGAPGLTVTRPDGAVFALRPPGTRDGGDDALVIRRKTS